MLSEKVDANDRIRAKQTELGLPGDDALPFLCECHDVTCRALVRLTGAEYAEVRSSPGRCVVADGHPHGGRVVITGNGYVVADP